MATSKTFTFYDIIAEYSFKIDVIIVLAKLILININCLQICHICKIEVAFV